MSPVFAAFVIFLLVERTTELGLAERNRRWAIRQGGRESGRSHYPVLVGMHVLFYLSLVAERVLSGCGWSTAWPLWITLLAIGQALRAWSIASLGKFWNTRIIVVPGTESVRRGPYRFVRHPNYIAVGLEILSIPMLAGAWRTAVVFSALNLLMMCIRIPAEERALRDAATGSLAPVPRFLPMVRFTPKGRRLTR
jgi:methyltransferase